MSVEDLPEHWAGGCLGGAPLLGALLATPGNVRPVRDPLLATGTDSGPR